MWHANPVLLWLNDLPPLAEKKLIGRAAGSIRPDLRVIRTG
jgi:hypothetical protein